MKRGDVILVRFPHPSGIRGKKRPAVVVKANAYNQTLRTIVVAEVTKNQTMANDAACMFVGVNTPEGMAIGLKRDSVVSCLVLATIDRDRVELVLGTLSGAMTDRLNVCLKAAFGLP
jgi:mRNA-degrading endonuclease toxin of MazEF toxin-antitoxin module